MNMLLDDFLSTIGENKTAMIIGTICFVPIILIISHLRIPEVIPLAWIYMKASVIDLWPSYDAKVSFIDANGERVSRLTVFILTESSAFHKAMNYLISDIVDGLKFGLYFNIGLVLFFTAIKQHSRRVFEKDQRIINTQVVDAAQLKKIMRRNAWRVSDE